MSKNISVSEEKIGESTHLTKNAFIRMLVDLKYLVKGLVLVANVFPVLAGFWLAVHFAGDSIKDHLGLLATTMIGSLFVVAGALVLNNWYEVDLDKKMARTQKRPTVTGSFTLKQVFVLGISFTVIGFFILSFATKETWIYAFVGWVAYVLLYTVWMKRRYTLNTVMGSLSGAVTPLIGWGAISSTYHYVPLVLALLLFIWQMPHTFAIAIRRHDEYKAAGVAMLPVVRGFDFTKRQMIVYVACLLPLPFFLSSIGMWFVIIATVLNVLWLLLSIGGFFTNSDKKWARAQFLFSVNYLAILFVVMIIETLPAASS
ncbi:MAG TPA: heme o synthase [Sporosarcina sp.]|nr:heme o synthase [Sporosarcina sp.]